MKSKLEIYSLCVCFASVVCLVISLGISSYALISINFPTLTMVSHQYDRFQSNDSFWESAQYRHTPEGRKVAERPTEEILTEKRNTAFSLAKRQEIRNASQALIKSALFIFFSLIALFIHWRIAARCRES